MSTGGASGQRADQEGGDRGQRVGRELHEWQVPGLRGRGTRTAALHSWLRVGGRGVQGWLGLWCASSYHTTQTTKPYSKHTPLHLNSIAYQGTRAANHCSCVLFGAPHVESQ